MKAVRSAIRRKAIAGALGLAIGTAGLLALGPATIAEAAPVGCTSDFVYTTATSSNLIHERSQDGTDTTINTGAFSALTIALSPSGSLYAFSTAAATGTHLYRIDSDGAATDLGIPVGMPATGTQGLAAFDDSGNLWVGNGPVLYRVDVTTVTATVLPLSHNVIGDLAYVDGSMYAAGSPTQLARIDLSTGSETLATVPGGVFYPSAWSMGGHLYFGGNSVVEILGFDTAAPTKTGAITSLVASSGDGASCPTAPSPFLSAANDDFTNAPIGSAGGTTATVFSNDTDNGVAIAAADVTATLIDLGGATGAAIASDGTIAIPASVPAGTHTLTYKICRAAAATICDTATAKILIPSPPARGNALPLTGTDAQPLLVAGASLLAIGALALVLAWSRRRTGAKI